MQNLRKKKKKNCKNIITIAVKNETKEREEKQKDRNKISCLLSHTNLQPCFVMDRNKTNAKNNYKLYSLSLNRLTTLFVKSHKTLQLYAQPNTLIP